MNTFGCLQLGLFLIGALVPAFPLGRHLGRVWRGKPARWLGWLTPLERAAYRWCGVRCGADGEPAPMGWRTYLGAVVAFGVVSFVAVFALQLLQHRLPGNPMGLPAVRTDLAFNTAVSFVTNTNWQAYGGETTMSYTTQMLGLGTQNFVSAAVGMAVLAALARGMVRREGADLGNFWQDLVRTVLYVLLPASLVLAALLVAEGVVQSFAPYTRIETAAGEQILPLGPAASQVAIKQLGTNGGGFFNANSAHPLENPTALSNLLQSIAILLVPAACCIAFGELVRDRRQGHALLATMTVMLLAALAIAIPAEVACNPVLSAAGVDQVPSDLQGGGNLEGKEVRFGAAASATWAVATTAASNGSVNAMHDSFTPIGGMVPMVLMQLGEVVFGGAGSGLYGLLLFAVVAVFVAGLLVGRTPDWLGKKIEPHEMKLALLGLLAPTVCVLIGTAVAVGTDAGRAGIQDPGAHGFAEVLYALSSAANNNGSAFAGLSADTPFYNLILGVCMLVGRFVPIVAVLALAGSLAGKRRMATGPGTLPTWTPTFVVFLIAVVLLVGALTFLPALALGPLAEHFALPEAR
jgi:K+-transporting ATPase ATPase A chain